MNKYTADLHFFHNKEYILKNRNSSTMEELHLNMSQIWNINVDINDNVFIIGDIALCRNREIEQLNEILSNLNGNKFLIKGNHDEEKLLKKIEHNFVWIKDRYIVKEKDDGKIQHLFLDHYPLLTWKNAHHGSWQLHGHCHGSLIDKSSTRLDVGWDVWHKPISFEEIKEQFKNKTYVIVDHHGK